MRTTQSAGFTLLELMIAVAAIAILAVIAVPNYLEQIRKGKRAEAVRAIGDIQLRQERWRADRPAYGNTTGADEAAGNLFGSVAAVTSYNSGLSYYSISATNNTGTTYTLTATRKGELASDPKCANFVLEHGRTCAGAAAPGVTHKCMSDNKNVDYCWRQ
jgi:type IV pilus assembly protein PilE